MSSEPPSLKAAAMEHMAAIPGDEHAVGPGGRVSNVLHADDACRGGVDARRNEFDEDGQKPLVGNFLPGLKAPSVDVCALGRRVRLEAVVVDFWGHPRRRGLERRHGVRRDRTAKKIDLWTIKKPIRSDPILSGPPWLFFADHCETVWAG